MDIGGVKLSNNVFLAPMAGITDIPFRRIVSEYSVSPGLTFTEMASSRAMAFSSERTERIIETLESERPVAVQIFGSDVENIVSMVKKLNEYDNIDIIDINMGCPAPKIVKNGDGAGLLLDLKKVEKILTESVKVSKKPITVKTRKGYDDNIITAVEVAKIAERAGVKMITVHGRTKQQYYSSVVDLEIIKKVKEAVSIPVIGNGDIVDIESAEKMFEYTGCDGIMIARGSLGNPWIFRSIIEGKEYEVTSEEKKKVILKHIKYAREYENEKIACFKMRKHIGWYLKGIKNASKIKEEIMRKTSLEDVEKIINDVL
ncbi:MAG: tRNA dihydrouridine synthase DusB [Clostridia bacterium]|nr:tRNA dihydrouridine synthase DusB [Clostridia bacterium]